MPSLLDLNNDVLRAILARTCASDQLNLHVTCSRVNNVMTTPEFRQERCEIGAAQVSVSIPTPFQLYQEHMQDEEDEAKETDARFQSEYGDFGYRDPEYGHEQNDARIYVDGKLAGKSSFTLLPRNNRDVNFHEMCDSISSDLQETGCAFFDPYGRPSRITSVKEALANDKRPLLYVNSFDLMEPEYRTTTTTGAKALHKILMEAAALKDKWSIAIYIPDARSQFTPEDREMERTWRMNYRHRSAARTMGEEEEGSDMENDEDWSTRRHDLTKLDMRQFFRAGFRQTKETVVDHSCFFLFAVPSFLQLPMSSHEEAMSIVIEEKPKPPHEKSRDEKKLLELMKKTCAEKRRLDDALRLCQLPIEESPLFRHLMEEIHRARRELQTTMDSTAEMLRDAEAKQRIFTQAFEAQTASEMSSALTSLFGQEVEVSDEALAEHMGSQSTRELLGQQLEELNAGLRKQRDIVEKDLPANAREIDERERNANSQFREAMAKDIESLQQKTRELEARVRSDVSKLFKDGNADAFVDTIINSDAIHACACNLQPDYVDLLMNYIPNHAKKRQAINSLDANGETPLRIAAASGVLTSSCPELRLQTCEKIMELGGDKNLVDASGLTALGKFRKADQDMRDFWSSYGSLTLANPNYVAQVRSSPALEEALRPVLGPTAADEAVLDAVSESEGDSDGEYMVDDGDEEEEEGGGNEDENAAVGAD